MLRRFDLSQIVFGHEVVLFVRGIAASPHSRKQAGIAER